MMNALQRRNAFTPRKRIRFRYSLRIVFVLVVLAAVGVSWFHARLQRAKMQGVAVMAILSSGGVVQYDNYVLRQRLRNVLRCYTDDLVADVIGLSIVNDSQLEHINGFSQLREMELDGPAVTDAGLKHLVQLHQLKRLSFNGTSVTDKGFGELKRALPGCTIEQ